MYNPKTPTKTSIRSKHETSVGESIEGKLRRIKKNNEPIKDTAPLIYTNRSEGVLPQFNPRADRFEQAVEEMDAKARNHIAKRQERFKENMEKEKATETSNKLTTETKPTPEKGPDTGATAS